MLFLHFKKWAKGKKIGGFRSLILEREIFSPQELARVVHLMHTLNLLSTIASGFFARNDRTREFLENGLSNFGGRDELIARLNRASEFILSLNLPSQSIWWSKSSSFSLVVLCAWHIFELECQDRPSVTEKLIEFAKDMPPEYERAAREGVNDRKQRIDRHKALSKALGLSEEERPINN